MLSYPLILNHDTGYKERSAPAPLPPPPTPAETAPNTFNTRLYGLQSWYDISEKIQMPWAC